MSKVAGTAPFKQPAHGQGKTSSAKNKGMASFQQNPARGKAGKTSSKKNPTNVSFQNDRDPAGKTSSKKNPGQASFVQPNPAKKNATTPKWDAKNVGKGAKTKKAGKVAPPAGGKFKSVDQVVAYRKSKYGI